MGVGKRGEYELVHGDLPRQRSFGTTLRFTGPVPADSRQLLLLLLFLTFSVLVANPKKLLYTVANPARGLLNREKRTKVNAIGTQLRDPINSELTRWRMAVINE